MSSRPVPRRHARHILRRLSVGLIGALHASRPRCRASDASGDRVVLVEDVVEEPRCGLRRGCILIHATSLAANVGSGWLKRRYAWFYFRLID
ncbi:uncharacterized protein A4U43_C02F9060 [Asparagus officinalis]|uniref:Uncharacterized protein n=1 Tax=Asparagus officinalis TaxID=4686 RepID=A0A5P1FIX5_ASPOF|nr:uncharacterized protein A4U43_C02F9060 [Asparagus officinalis]